MARQGSGPKFKLSLHLTVNRWRRSGPLVLWTDETNRKSSSLDNIPTSPRPRAASDRPLHSVICSLSPRSFTIAAKLLIYIIECHCLHHFDIYILLWCVLWKVIGNLLNTRVDVLNGDKWLSLWLRSVLWEQLIRPSVIGSGSKIFRIELH